LSGLQPLCRVAFLQRLTENIIILTVDLRCCFMVIHMAVLFS
jgi:hypothetical protein